MSASLKDSLWAECSSVGNVLWNMSIRIRVLHVYPYWVLHSARMFVFSGFISRFNRHYFFTERKQVNSKTLMVTSSILRISMVNISEVLIEVELHICFYMDECMYLYVSINIRTVFYIKKDSLEFIIVGSWEKIKGKYPNYSPQIWLKYE